MKTLFGIPVKTDSRIRRGSLIGYRDGSVSWYGPIDRLPNRELDEVQINPDDLKELALEESMANETTSSEVASHAARLMNASSWKVFARYYNSDEKAWAAIKSVAASATNQAADKKPE